MKVTISKRFVPLPAAVLLLVCSGLCTCPGGIIRHDRQIAAYRRLGRNSDFQCVGEVIFVEESGRSSKGKACAVLIAPRWVLTAGHVGRKTDIEKHRYKFGDEQYRAVRRVPHPGFDPKASGPDARLAITAAGADLALVQLDRPVRDIGPASRYRAAGEVGQTMVKIGYGYMGNGKAGPSRPFTQARLGGNNVIDAAGGTFDALTFSQRVLLCDIDAPNDSTKNRLGEPIPLDLEVGSSPGDSGGGWFIHDGCSWKLVAITSGEIPSAGELQLSSSMYGAVFAGIRVSTANDWIDSAIALGELTQLQFLCIHDSQISGPASGIGDTARRSRSLSTRPALCLCNERRQYTQRNRVLGDRFSSWPGGCP